MRRRLLPLLVVLLTGAGLLVATTPPAGAATGSGNVVFHVYDAAGQRITWSAFRTLQRNGAGSSGDNDVLLDPASLTVLSGWPLFSTGGGTGDPAVRWPGRPASLSMAWPTSDGYSALVLDLGGPGTVDFTALAARQAVARLELALQARPTYVPSAAFLSSAGTARVELAASAGATSESDEGAHGARGLDAAVHATTLLLAEYGVQYARAHRAEQRPQWGVTLDDTSGGATDLATVRDLVDGDPQDGWVRLVFDAARTAASYTAEVRAAHAAGLHVTGQILDSSDMAGLSLARWQQRVAEYVTALPSVDEWEVGNEVNGNWLGHDVTAKIQYAAAYVKAHTTARTMLTLYWQLGEDDPAHSMFTWAKANLSPQVLATIDDLGVSLYPEDHPMGAALDRVTTTLHRLYPQQRIAITELDYWSPDLDHTWWWGSRTDPTGAGRRAVATLYQAASLGYPYSGGGTYFWYYLEEALPRAALWTALHDVHAAVVR